MVKPSALQRPSPCSSPPLAPLSLASIPLKPSKSSPPFSFIMKRSPLTRTYPMDPPSSTSADSSSDDDPNAIDNLSFSRTETSKSSEAPSASLGEDDASSAKESLGSMCNRQRLQQHRMQMSGKAIIPDTWGHEEQLQGWVNYGIVEDALRPPGLMMARAALVRESQHRGNKPVRTSAALSADVEVS